jgi:putative Mg2+ transporter-C (MgtC) family protein
MSFDLHVLGEAALRLLMAVLMGSAIGIERQWHQKMAGLRTNALVALGACGYVLFSWLVDKGDPTRVAAQVVTGIGFLGAGVILREGVNVHGLNTAATLWCSAMVGTFAGAGFYGPSVLAAILVVATNVLLRPFVRAINGRLMIATDVETYYTIEIVCPAAEEARLRLMLLTSMAQGSLSLRRIESSDVPDSGNVKVTAHALAAKRIDSAVEQIIGRLSLDNVSAANWQIDRTIPES